MSKYTTEVRYIVESMAGKDESQDRTQINDMVNSVSTNIIGYYPIFDESYRQVLNNKIILHFYTREIGYETVGLWRFKLNVKMNEIMPYFNQLYESQLIHFDPLLDFHYTKEGSSNGTTDAERRGSATEDVSTTRNGDSRRDGNESKTQTNVGAESGQNSGTETSENRSENNESRNGVNINSNAIQNEGEGSNRGSTESADRNDSIQGYSDTPQGALNNLEEGAYLTNGSKQNSTSESTQANEGSSKTKNEEANSNIGTTSDTSKTSEETSGSSARTGNEYKDSENTDIMSDNVHTTETKSEDENKTSVNNDTSAENITNFNSYLEHISGKRGLTSYSKLLMEFRDTFLNIDMMIIQSLEDLFMGVW